MKIEASDISIQSKWGVALHHPLLTHRPRSSALTVLFPGAYYSCDAPLLYFARKVSLQLGFDVLSLEYGYQAARVKYQKEDVPRLVADSLEAVQSLVEGYEKIWFVSKSLGTHVAGEIAQLLGYDRVSHIFLTPIASAIPHMLASHGLAVIGTNDPLFEQEHIQQIAEQPALEIKLVDHANHFLEVEDAESSLRILSDVVGWCEKFMNS